MARARLTPEAQQAKLDAAHRLLVDAVSQLASSEDWLAYLAAMGRFHTYSATNVLMIAAQRPQATQVAGFHTWKSLGRQVVKGAKGIAIWAPVTRRVEPDADPGHPDATEAVARRCVGFRLAYVFDIADTEGDPLPTSPATPRLLVGEAPAGLWEALAGQVEAAGYRLELVDAIAAAPGANGATKIIERVVEIVATDRSPAAMAKTLAHELAHVLLHAGAIEETTLARSRAEVEAESVAYLVCDAVRLDSMTYSLGYVTDWSGGDLDQVLAAAGAAQRCARTILEGIPASGEDGPHLASPPSGTGRSTPVASR